MLYYVIIAISPSLFLRDPRVVCLAEFDSKRIYTNDFAVCIHGGPDDADRLANKYGFVNQGQIGNLHDCFSFKNHKVKKRSLDYSHTHHKVLKRDPQVLWVEQQHIKKRTKRDLMHHETGQSRRRSSVTFPDPLFPSQWYLNRGARGGFDMNVKGAWEMGYSGKNVVVTILDDGIQTNHPDLVLNYDPNASTDINDNDNDPMPQDNGDNKHGTRCAGEVAAEAGNAFCGVGIAYNSSIGGVRMLDGTVTDEVEARALSLNPNHIDIYSASWGPEDDGKTVDGPGALAKRAFTDGVARGRNGLGSIFVWASGNGGKYSDNCNCDGYTNSIYTLSISSATQSGLKPWYLEECSSTLATTYSSGHPRQDSNVVTVDMDTSYFQALRSNSRPNANRLCTHSHTGTSASAPIAAAICALALEANPLLTWRDMQYLVMLSSKSEPLEHEDGWITNGVQRKVSHKFGYGLMDATEMVKLAERWVRVPPQHVCENAPDTQEKTISGIVGEELEVSRRMHGCEGTPKAVLYLEHVQVQISLQYYPRGNLHIVLVSPAGTESSVLMPRSHDLEETSFNNWAFLSVHFWGESPAGEWKLRIRNEGKQHAVRPGKLKQWSLVFRGTSIEPFNSSIVRTTNTWRRSNRGHKYSPLTREAEYPSSNACAGDKRFQLLERYGKCVERCPEGQYGDIETNICKPCHPSCAICYGPGADNCYRCYSPKVLLGHECVDTCPVTYYHDMHLHECLPCSSQCASCESSSENCKTCRPNFFRFEKNCVPRCPSHTFPQSDKCNLCHPSCESCHGPTDRDCLTCTNPNYLSDGSCVPLCPEGFFSDDVLHFCRSCRPNCKQCQVNGQCISCFNNWYLKNDGSCRPKSVRTKDCPQEKCKFCKGNGKNDCIECYYGRLLVEGQCVISCPDGYYQNDNGECILCHESCATCKRNKPNECTKCKKGLVLASSSCLAACISGTYRSSDGRCLDCYRSCDACTSGRSNDCTNCQSGYVLVNGSCVLGECPQGYYEEGSLIKECMPCHHSCYTCTGGSPEQCLSCPKNLTVHNGMCLMCLNDEYIDKTAQSCKKCHKDCSSCSGSSNRQCTSCKAPLQLNPSTNSCVPCCSSQVDENLYKEECCSCNANTGTCIGASGHTRSITDSISWTRPTSGLDSSNKTSNPTSFIVTVVVLICISTVLVYFIILGALQAYSYGYCHRRRGVWDYEKVPNGLSARYDKGIERVSLTQAEMDEEDDIFEKT